MININMENIRALVKMAYLSHAQEAFGDAGAEGITALLDTVKLIYQRCPPEGQPKTLTVVVGISATPRTPAIGTLGAPESISTYQDVATRIAATDPTSHAIVELVKDNTFCLLFNSTAPDVERLAQESLVYHYDDGVERILAKNYDDYVPKISSDLKSNFAVPTFHSLEKAFMHYGASALETKCRILSGIWEGGVDGPRLILVNRPESIMRDSLIQTLQLLLRDANVRPEQNTDETKPVDVRVEWFGSSASALIEVKWLGKSTAVSRNFSTEPRYTEYGPSRAQEGANQLADYMDREIRHSTATSHCGYLVVFDARRRNTKGPADPLTENDAMYYVNKDLSYNPNHAKLRADFADPVRFFLNPRKSHFRTA